MGFADGIALGAKLRQQQEQLKLDKQAAAAKEKLYALEMQKLQFQMQQAMQQVQGRQSAASAASLLQQDPLANPAWAHGTPWLDQANTPAQLPQGVDDISVPLSPQDQARLKGVIQRQRLSDPEFAKQWEPTSLKPGETLYDPLTGETRQAPESPQMAALKEALAQQPPPAPQAGGGRMQLLDAQRANLEARRQQLLPFTGMEEGKRAYDAVGSQLDDVRAEMQALRQDADEQYEGNRLYVKAAKGDPEALEALELKRKTARDSAATTTVTVGGGRTEEYGKIDPGFRRVIQRDAQGNVTAVYEEPLQGSKEAYERGEKADKKAAQLKGHQEWAMQNAEDIGDILSLATDGRTLPSVGRLSETIATIDPESRAAQVRQLVAGIKARVTISNLQQIRQHSPTGAAVGSASDKDLQTLADLAGSLDLSTPQVAIPNLIRLNNLWLDTFFGQGHGPARLDSTGKPVGDTPPPVTIQHIERVN